MVMYVTENPRRCRICGQRMLMWRWRWAHRRCARTITWTDAHPWQEYNAHGNTCHYPGCTMTEEEHTR